MRTIWFFFFFQSRACLAWCDSGETFWVQQSTLPFATWTPVLGPLPWDGPWAVPHLASRRNEALEWSVRKRAREESFVYITWHRISLENLVCSMTPSWGAAKTQLQLREQIMWVHLPDGHILQSYQHKPSYFWQRPALILENRIQKHITYVCVSTYTYVCICTHTYIINLLLCSYIWSEEIFVYSVKDFHLPLSLPDYPNVIRDY